MIDKEYVKVDRQGNIAYIEFGTPQSNALPGNILAALRQAILEQGAQEEVALLVLQSGGDRAFCGGASFEELLAISNPAQGKQFFMGFAGVINAIRTCGKIVVAKVQGKAVGGGVGIASAVDYCMATRHAAFRLSELAIGIGPFVIGPAVERKVGVSQFTKLAITPEEWQSANWGLQQGLYHQVFEDAQSMEEGTQAFVERLAGYSPQALAELKKVFWKDTDHWSILLEERAEMSGKLVLSDFTAQAIARFKSKE
jgi:methylglutaconyl-CoA hydratase